MWRPVVHVIVFLPHFSIILSCLSFIFQVMWNFLGKIFLSRVKQCIWKKHKRPSPILWSQYSDGKFLWTASIIHITEDYNIWMALFVVSEIYFGQMKLCLHLFKGLRRLQESFKGRKNPHFTSVSNTTPVRTASWLLFRGKCPESLPIGSGRSNQWSANIGACFNAALRPSQ